jgi:hypothetical protein
MRFFGTLSKEASIDDYAVEKRSDLPGVEEDLRWILLGPLESSILLHITMDRRVEGRLSFGSKKQGMTRT